MDALHFPTLIRNLLPHTFFNDSFRLAIINVFLRPFITTYNTYINFKNQTSSQYLARVQVLSMEEALQQITQANITISDEATPPYSFDITGSYKTNVLVAEGDLEIRKMLLQRLRDYVNANKLAGTTFTDGSFASLSD